jgi:hypothetical protein
LTVLTVTGCRGAEAGAAGALALAAGAAGAATGALASVLSEHPSNAIVDSAHSARREQRTAVFMVLNDKAALANAISAGEQLAKLR